MFGRAAGAGLALAGALSLGLFLAWLAPAWLMGSFVSRASDGRLTLHAPQGSFWRGRGESLTIAIPGQPAMAFTKITWHVLPARFAIEIRADDPASPARGVLIWKPDGISVVDLQATAPVEALLRWAPEFDLWRPRGTLRIASERVLVEPLRIAGKTSIDWLAAELALSRVAPLGDYRLTLDRRGDGLSISLSTLAGPLRIEGTGRYRFKLGGELHGTAHAAASAREALAPLINLMGRPRNDGAIDFRVALPPLGWLW